MNQNKPEQNKITIEIREHNTMFAHDTEESYQIIGFTLVSKESVVVTRPDDHTTIYGGCDVQIVCAKTPTVDQIVEKQREIDIAMKTYRETFHAYKPEDRTTSLVPFIEAGEVLRDLLNTTGDEYLTSKQIGVRAALNKFYAKGNGEPDAISS